MRFQTLKKEVSGVHINKIAKMLIGVENVVVEGIDFDREQGCVVISARQMRVQSRPL